MLRIFLASPQCRAVRGSAARRSFVVRSNAWANLLAFCRAKRWRGNDRRNARAAATVPVLPRPRTVDAPMATRAVRLWMVRRNAGLVIADDSSSGLTRHKISDRGRERK